MNARFGQLTRCLPHPPAWRFDYAALERFEPIERLMARMADTPQSPRWHGEGDVLAHTRRVCDALCGLQGFVALEERRRNALALAALLHDAGKPGATRQEGGDWVAPRHGARGAQIVRKLLWQEFGLCGEAESMRFREAVCLLVRYHTRPLHLLEQDDPETAALKLASNSALAPDFTLESLCLLAEADALGRDAPDVGELCDRAALSRALAGEAGCLQGPYPFRSPVTREALFAGGSVWKDQAMYDAAWGEVIMVCGLPGTGKDTWISRHLPGLGVVSLDQERRRMGIAPTGNQGPVAAAARSRACEYLRRREPFVWNATCLTARLRERSLRLFSQYHAAARIVYLETPWEENLRRNALRSDAVPEPVIDDMLSILSPPEAFEARFVEWQCL